MSVSGRQQYRGVLALTVMAGVGLILFGLFAAPASSRPSAIAASCARGSMPAIVGGNFRCLRVGAHCSSRYQSVYRHYGYRCVSGSLRKYVKSPPAPTTTVVVTTTTPAPPTPVYQTGHYVGTTSQFQPISFDVILGQIQNVKSGDINSSCNPQFNGYGGNLNITWWAIDADGSVNASWSWNSTLSITGGPNAGTSFPEQGTTTFTAHVQGASAAGTVREDFSFDAFSVGYVCSSGLVTWNATLAP